MVIDLTQADDPADLARQTLAEVQFTIADTEHLAMLKREPENITHASAAPVAHEEARD